MRNHCGRPDGGLRRCCHEVEGNLHRSCRSMQDLRTGTELHQSSSAGIVRVSCCPHWISSGRTQHCSGRARQLAARCNESAAGGRCLTPNLQCWCRMLRVPMKEMIWTLTWRSSCCCVPKSWRFYCGGSGGLEAGTWRGSLASCNDEASCEEEGCFREEQARS